MKSSYTRRLATIPALLALIMGGISCDSGDSTSTTPTTTPTTTITETFAGSITVNGAATFTFPTTTSGTVSATLRSIAPVSTIQLSLAIGTWNGINCQVVLPNDRAGVGSVISGNVSGAGTLCVRISDIGQMTQTTTFEVVVTHP